MTVYDFSFHHPTIDELRAAGCTGVARYLSDYSTNKNASADELAAYWAEGWPVLLVWENDTGDYKGGYQAGRHAGTSARAKATALGLPPDAVLYWAIDTRLANMQRAVALDYGRGFTDAAGVARPYGEGALIDQAVDAGLCDGGWMPETWGPCAHVVLIQRVGASPVGGTDLNDPQQSDWGGHLPAPQLPTPTPSPEDDDMDVTRAVYVVLQGFALWGNTDKKGQQDAVKKVLQAKDDAGRDHAVAETLNALAGL